MEATGVYGEGLAYFLFASGYTVAVEPPLNIQRKFPANASKTDELDCQYIAEYACRYVDKLAFWKPRADILEKVKLLLTTRQHFSVQLTGHKNALIAVNRKKVASELAKQVHQDMIKQINKHIKAIDQEIRRLIDEDPNFKQTFLLLMSVPGIGLQLAAHLLIHMQETLDPRVLAQLNMRVALRFTPLQLRGIMVRQFCENYFIWAHVLSVLIRSSSNIISSVKSRKASTRKWS
jgi:transposase